MQRWIEIAKYIILCSDVNPNPGSSMIVNVHHALYIKLCAKEIIVLIHVCVSYLHIALKYHIVPFGYNFQTPSVSYSESWYQLEMLHLFCFHLITAVFLHAC